MSGVRNFPANSKVLETHIFKLEVVVASRSWFIFKIVYQHEKTIIITYMYRVLSLFFWNPQLLKIDFHDTKSRYHDTKGGHGTMIRVLDTQVMDRSLREEDKISARLIWWKSPNIRNQKIHFHTLQYLTTWPVFEMLHSEMCMLLRSVAIPSARLVKISFLAIVKHYLHISIFSPYIF